MAGNRPGPFRFVSDGELRDIFYLTPQSGTAFMLRVGTGPFPHANEPIVTPILREMLYLFQLRPGERLELRKRIEAAFADREHIPIRAKLLSLIGRVQQEPWAFPALLDTKMCRELYTKLNGVAGASDTVASLGSDPVSDLGIAAVLKKIFDNVPGSAAVKAGAAGMAAFGVALTRYFAGKSKDYYAFYTKRISDELALRGVPPSSL